MLLGTMYGCTLGPMYFVMQVKKYEYRGIKSVCVYGGGSIKDQTNIINKGKN
jgi:hypothetical protein